MSYKEIITSIIGVVKKYKSLLIYIQGSPDPDAIASAFALHLMCASLGIKSDIYASSEPSLRQNQAMIKKIGIPVKYESNPGKIDPYDAYVITDFQSAMVKGLTGKIPCAIHIDHHEELKEDINVELKIIREKAGSVSTIITLALREWDFPARDDILAKASTALVLGIQTDTDKYIHASDDDIAALTYLSPFSNHSVVNEISGIPLSDMTLEILGKAIKNRVAYKDWVIAGVGFIDEKFRDSIAIIADFMLREKDARVVVIFAIIEKDDGKNLVLDASVRTSDEDLDLDFLIKQITSQGGGRKFKGAYQVNLDYFAHCRDRESLWELVNKTTVDAFSRQRDNIHILEMKGFYKKVKKSFSSIFRVLMVLCIVVLFGLSTASCARKFGMVRTITPVERPDLDVDAKKRCALIRMRDFDMAVQEIGMGDWARLMEHELYHGKKGDSEFRIPRLNFFHIAVTNAGEVPVKIDEVFLEFGTKQIKALTLEEVKEKCKSPAYSGINFPALLGIKRIVSDKLCLREIDYSVNTFGYLPEYIVPGDTIISIAAFDWIPVEYRKLRLIVSIGYSGTEKKKSVDFDFHRSEHRTRGRYFNKVDVSE